MRKSLLIAIFVVVYFSSLTSANLAISPNPMEVTGKVRETINLTATLTNNFNFAIQDFTFSNLTGFTFEQISIEPNATGNIEFKINIDEPIESAITTKVKFNYLVEIPSDPQTHNIDITASGFSPSFIVIHEQDTIIWKNIDDITHTVTSSLFDLTVQPNSTVQKIFTEEGTITYQDLTLFLPGTVEVLNRTSQQAVHNPVYDTDWNVNLHITADPTQLEITPIEDTNFTIDAMGLTEGFFKIKNIGNETAQSVHLSTELNWLDFEENDFNLGMGQQKFIDYRIMPLILETNETNKTYEIELKAKGLNTNETSFKINIFIPFLNMETDLTEEEKLLVLWERICKNNPNAPLCTGKLEIEGGNGSVTIRDPEVQYNYSTSTIREMLRRQRQSEDSQQRLENEITALTGQLATNNPQILKFLNDSLTLQQENERKSRRNSNVGLIFLVGLAMIGAILIIGFKLIRVNKKERLMEGYP